MDMRVPARDLALDAVEDGLSVDSRMARTVLPFLFRPGVPDAGVDQRPAGTLQLSPLRLYLLASVVFFLVTGLAGDRNPIQFNATLDDPEVEPAVQLGGDAHHVPPGTEEQHQRLRSPGLAGPDHRRPLAGLREPAPRQSS